VELLARVDAHVKSVPRLGVVTLVAAYAVAFLVFNLLFDFSFLAHTPLYVASLDPKGRLDAWVALSFLVTTVAVIVVASAFDFWPVSALIRSRRQPAFGLASTILILAASILLYLSFTRLVGFDPVQHLVRWAVSLIYGIFLVQIMMRHQLFAGWRQPLRGVALTAIAGLLALLMYSLYAISASLSRREPCRPGLRLRTGDLGRKRDALASRFR